jgi:cell division transport system permease protein
MMNKNQQQPNKLKPLTLWLLNHCRAFVFSIGDIVRSPIASILTLAVIGIAMALPTGMLVLLRNFQIISQHWQGQPSISLYLKQNTNQQQINTLIKTLTANPAIAKVDYISPNTGLKNFEQQTHFDQLVKQLKQNPLPPVIVVTPTPNHQSPEKLQTLLNFIKTMPGVDVGQLDLAWVKRLYYLISLGQRFTYTLAMLFALAVILIIGNTIRLTTQNHRQEIIVLRLIGATTSFIRRPLLYRGVLYGMGAAVAQCKKFSSSSRNLVSLCELVSIRDT